MTTYLVTGGCGFIGSNLVDRLTRMGERVVILDDLSRRGSQKNAEWLRAQHGQAFELIRGDVRDADVAERAARDTDVIVHLAGQVAVTTSVTDPRTDFMTNALGTFNVLEAARRSGRNPVFLYASTNKVYGGMEDLQIKEGPVRYMYANLPEGASEAQPLDFHSPYGCSKGAADQYVRDYHRIYGMPTVVLRQSAIYGPRQFGMEDQGWVSWLMIAAVLGKPICIYGDGKQVRDLLWVEDLVEAYLAAIRHIGRAAGQVYNMGGGPENTLSVWTEFGPALEKLHGSPIPVRYGDWRPGDQRVYVSDISKARRELDWSPRVSVSEGLERLYRWVRENRALFDQNDVPFGPAPRMKVLVALTYYRPHVSGLTIYVERLAQALVQHGHEVTVLTSQYDKNLPLEQVRDGVRVRRVPVAWRISKGVIMPSFGWLATQMVREHDVLSLHLPQFDAAGLAARGRLLHRPTVLTYHCDLLLPPGLFNRVVDRVVYGANYLSATFAHRIVAYTQDYADHSPLLSKFQPKIRVIPPPVVMAPPRAEDVEAFHSTHHLHGRPVIGMATRFATEKGVEYLLDALPPLLERWPNLKVLFAGQYQNVMGEEADFARLRPQIDKCGEQWEFLGTLNQDQLPAFFASLDCLVVPSLNSTESFGLVQVEAMLSGTPVVASNLPGVRQPVRMTGMGEIVPLRDSDALAQAVGAVLSDKPRYVRPRAEIEARFDLDATVMAYETLFKELVGG